MTKAPEFTLQSIPNQQVLKIIGIASFIAGLVVLVVAITLYSVEQIEQFMFHVLLGLSALMLLESFALPALLKKFAKGAKFQFYEDLMKFETREKQFFTIPYDNITGVRSEPIEKTHHYKNKMVSNIYLKMDETKLPNFPNLYIKKGELKLPSIPDENDPLRKINDVIGNR